jgi:hypothetical protein
LTCFAQVLVNVRAAPINAGDLYNVELGATPYSARALARIHSRARAR